MADPEKLMTVNQGTVFNPSSRQDHERAEPQQTVDYGGKEARTRNQVQQEACCPVRWGPEPVPEREQATSTAVFVSNAKHVACIRVWR
jgi:hypothetical protein